MRRKYSNVDYYLDKYDHYTKKDLRSLLKTLKSQKGIGAKKRNSSKIYAIETLLV